MPEQPSLEQIAEAIHKARWPEDKQTESTPFADEDENGRTYCFRLARAVRQLYLGDELYYEPDHVKPWR